MDLRIKELRRGKRLTQESLARDAGISRNYLSEIETGAKTPNLVVLERIARALGVELLGILVNPDEDMRVLRLSAALDGATPQEWEEVIRHAEALRVARRLLGIGEGTEG